MEVRKSDGSFEEFNRKKLGNIIKKAFSSAGVECTSETVKTIIDSLYIYDGILCSSIRKQLEERLIHFGEPVLLAYQQAKTKKEEVKHFVEEKKKFIEKYKKSTNTADATVDDNSNVGNKNIAVINSEIHKPDNIQISRSMISDKLKELFPKFNSKNYIKDLEHHVIYKNDEGSFAGAISPYTYSAKEVVIVTYNGQKLLIPFESLWDVVSEEAVCVDETNDVYQKLPENLSILDKSGNWTSVTHITKKKRHRDLVRVKTSFGEDIVVTDNHPMIVNEDDINDNVDAIDSLGMPQYKIGHAMDFGGKDTIDMSDADFTSEATDIYCFNQNEHTNAWCKRYVKADWNLGYFVGFFIGDGNYDNTSNDIHFTQKNRATLLKLNSNIYESLGVAGRLYQKKDITNCYSLEISSDYLNWLLRDYFKIQDKSYNKTLPFNVYDFTESFAKGIICGLIDSDGTVNGSDVYIRLASRSAILQCTELLRKFGFSVGNTMQSLPFSNNSSFKTNYTVWGVNFSIYKDSNILGDSYKLKNVIVIDGTPKYKFSGTTKITSIKKLSDEDSFVKSNDYIYDITTETRTFALNNLLVHNCVSITMYPFLTHGLKNLGGLSAAPKNIDSFCGMYCNLIFAVSSQYAGACLYKDQTLFIKDNGNLQKITAKELIERKLIDPMTFHNYQGDWEYADCSGVQVLEDGKLVDVTRVYRRKYSDKIYKITAKSGNTAYVSKDHRFKQLIQGRLLDVKAENLQVWDTVEMNKDYSSALDFTSKDFKKGWIIGMLCGDGCLTKEASVGLSVNYEQEYLGDIYNSYSEEIYGVTLHKNKGHLCWNYAKRSQTYLDAIHEDIIGTTAYDKHINLEGKSLDYVAGFLDGLFCSDGSYSEGHGIEIGLTNKELANNVHEAVGLFGFNTNIRVVSPRGKRKESYQQYISSRILKYLHHIHSKVLKSGCKKLHDTSREVYYYGYNALQGQGRHTSKKRNLWSHSSRPHEDWYNTDVISEIETFDNDDEYVYEIETSTHWYNCGGFITHNCATSEFLLYFTYFSKKEWGDDFYLRPDEVISKSVSRNKTIRNQIHQYWQQVIYTINQPAAARGFQSAFVNFSYFDRPFFDGMFGNFAFPDGTKPDWESLCWIQKEFMMWFNEERLKTVLTFPVESCTLLFKDGKFQDEDMYNFVCEEYARGHSFFTYISDSVDSLSSCCFDKSTRIMYSTHDSKNFVKCEEISSAFEKYGDEEIDAFVYNPYTGLRTWKPGKLVRTTTSSWVEFNKNDSEIEWRHFKVTPDHILPIKRGDKLIDVSATSVRVGDFLVYDKAQKELSEDDFTEIEYIEVKDINYITLNEPEYCYCIEVTDEENPYFVLSNGLITHNCRLKNKIQTKEFNFTNGNIGVQTGSKSVISFNLSRIIQDWYCSEYKVDRGIRPTEKFDETKYTSLKKYMSKITDRVYLYHAAYNELLWDMYDANLLPVYKAGFIDLNKQYLTLGLNGLNQAAEFLGIDCTDNPEYAKFCQEIFGFFKEQNELHKVKDGPHKLTFNTEQVPAESLAVKNYNWDKEDGYWVPDDTNLYASYVYKPNDKRLSVLDKIRMMGKNYIGDYLDGGSAAHINLDSHLSKEQYKKLIKYAADNGCNFSTFNVPNCECENCHYIAKQPFDVCPKCGSRDVSLWDRVIGYLTKIKNWSAGRRIEQKTRVYDNKIKDELKDD